MALEKNVGGTDRKLRAVGAVLLTLVAVLALRKGNRSTGLVAGLGAVGLGINAVVCFCGLNAALGLDTTAEE